MDTEGFDPQKLQGAPPLMPWPKFAEWIGMGDELIVVRSWVERGYLPSLKAGKRTMVIRGGIALFKIAGRVFSAAGA